MSAALPRRPLMSAHLATMLAADIRREHEAAEAAFSSAVEHAVRCGQLLADAKAQLPHGAWLPWLDEHFPASRRTAQGYMRLARNAEDAQALAHLGVEGALRQLAAPKAHPPLAARLERQERVIEHGLGRLRADLRRLHAGGAYTALGYSTWAAFIDAAFPRPADWDDEFRDTMRAVLLEPELECV